VPLAGGPEPVILAMLFAAEFISGFGVMALDISIGSIFAAVVPDQLRSRVSGAFQAVNYGTRPLGALAGGLFGTVLGLRPTPGVATVGGMAGLAVLLASAAAVPPSRRLMITTIRRAGMASGLGLLHPRVKGSRVPPLSSTQTDFVSRYSSIAARPFSRPRPEAP
jgi:MFS family permease